MTIDRLRIWFRRGAWTPLVELALIAALGVSLAHWTWIAFAPAPVAASTLAESSGAASGGLTVRRNLFGAMQENKVPPVADASPASKIKLLGVLSRGAKGSGRAIFLLETGKAKTVEAGSQVVPGLVLKEVYADHVLVFRGGAVERMKLDRRATAKI